MRELLSRRWWVFVVRGILAIIFGLLAVFWPGITLLVLVILLGAYLLVDGLFAIYHAFTHRQEHRPRWWLVFQGVLSVVLGALLLIWPTSGVLALVIVFGIWALASGIAQAVAAVQLRKEIPNEWMLIVSAILTILVGLGLILLPLAGAFAIALLIGCFAILLGIAQIALGMRLRRAHRDGDGAKLDDDVPVD
ncbi:HdeD family acid-resistance protein [Spiractinospora alimapuensis]|uniref:HdeD family acid-resistance protein n=1 Tax=Spiractinospora alimapuensis TaxID=2820884 RepID=UPI001F466DFF|nr:HdeD family acid-resistance protein [Spiractinospora alimapuensis]